MLSTLWAIVFILFALFIFLWIMRAILGNVGLGLWLICVALYAAYSGWHWLAFNDNLALQMLGYAIPGAILWGTAKGIQIGVRKHRAAKAAAADPVYVITDVEG